MNSITLITQFQKSTSNLHKVESKVVRIYKQTQRLQKSRG